MDKGLITLWCLLIKVRKVSVVILDVAVLTPQSYRDANCDIVMYTVLQIVTFSHRKGTDMALEKRRCRINQVLRLNFKQQTKERSNEFNNLKGLHH